MHPPSGMAFDPEEPAAAHDTIVRDPHDHGADTKPLGDHEFTQADEEWPVADLYWVEQGEYVASASNKSPDAVILHQSATAGRRRLPRPGHRGSLLVAAGAIGAILLAAIVINLLAGDGDADATADAPSVTRSSSSPATSPNTPSTPVPSGATALMDLQGMSLQEARARLEKAGLRVQVRNVQSDRPRGEILNQSPAAGAEVEENRLVVLVVSRGPAQSAPESASVPEVVGLAASDAVVTLRATGFDVRIQRVESSKKAGTVIRQSPAGGMELRRGTEVVLAVAETRPVIERVDVPEVVGMSVDAARRVLRTAGFTVAIVSVRSVEPAGQVVKQTPAAGEGLRESGRVTLRVSSGPALVDVPDVTGLDEQAARLELENAGFEVRVIDEPTSDPAEDGTVVGQTPLGGSRAEEASVVTLNVARLG